IKNDGLGGVSTGMRSPFYHSYFKLGETDFLKSLFSRPCWARVRLLPTRQPFWAKHQGKLHCTASIENSNAPLQ
ncbi:MAG: hypothetical protein VZR31_08865, partial [Lachnospiraceae bacterium]|nr:hypothetical protein [Lachnospiraceae bacterium]